MLVGLQAESKPLKKYEHRRQRCWKWHVALLTYQLKESWNSKVGHSQLDTTKYITGTHIKDSENKF